MNQLKKTFLALPVLLAAILLTGCASSPPAAQYDFGPLRLSAAERLAKLPAVRLADIDAPAWLDGRAMHYRLAYANEQQVRQFAHNRWQMPPPQLFSQRLKMRLVEAGGLVLSTADSGQAVPVLRIEMTDFIQVFDSESRSWSRVTIRASLFNGRTILAQKNFARDLPATTADAAGGARALADASDQAIGDLLLWLADQASRK
ncbi:MAG: putative lipoprotein [Burkholderiaceae bacterium]|nr:putative lipoprotein [Burkholderiaceae bacterium]